MDIDHDETHIEGESAEIEGLSHMDQDEEGEANRGGRSVRSHLQD